ncbi:MAG: hypothetical protein LBK01_00460, partial [Burkholderiaceae bacterium]|nr:hypothetical protein [Burkholderiaceae bacterium]
TSIRSAVIVLGNRQLQRWLLLLLMTDTAQGKGKRAALLYHAAGRARFMESLALAAPAWRSHAEVAFITGLVSVMQSVLDADSETLSNTLGLMPEVERALKGEEPVLSDLLALAIAMEEDDLRAANDLLRKAQIRPEVLSQVQRQTLLWVNQIVEADVYHAE